MHKVYFCFCIQEIRSCAPNDFLSVSATAPSIFFLYWNKRVDESNAEKFVAHMAEEFASYGIRELSSVAKTLRNWQSEIVNSFNHHNGRHISNGPVESVNSRIKTVKRNGNGYSNFERFRKRVIYSLNEDSSIKI